MALSKNEMRDLRTTYNNLETYISQIQFQNVAAMVEALPDGIEIVSIDDDRTACTLSVSGYDFHVANDTAGGVRLSDEVVVLYNGARRPETVYVA